MHKKICKLYTETNFNVIYLHENDFSTSLKLNPHAPFKLYRISEAKKIFGYFCSAGGSSINNFDHSNM